MPQKPHSLSLIEHFSVIIDPRMERGKAHRLINVILMSICAMLCGAETFVDFEDFGIAKQDWLKTFLDLPNGIPSHDTFGRIFALIDPQEFSECFRNWTQSLRAAISGEIVAIDGKTLRRSHDRTKGKKAIHMVSAWARENGLVLGQIKIDEKSNEITAIPELLRALELTGCIVTIDAMGCQKKIATEICDADADYVLALKGNHETIHDEVKLYLEDTLAKGFKDVPYSHLETVEKEHGRIETRRYWITDKIQWMEDRPEWEGLRSIGMVESVRDIQGVASTERRFFLCSIAPDAANFARAVRGHWAIENTLHWSLDVTFNEDQCRVRVGYAAQNLALLRHMTLNILKAETTKKRGIKRKQNAASWDNSYLLSLLKF